MADPTANPDGTPALFLAGQLALDFLNTQPQVDGELADFFQGSEDVLRWLSLSGAAVKRPPAPARSLLEPARALRDTIRRLSSGARPASAPSRPP